MAKLIQKIETVLPFSDVPIEIFLNGRNLIVTGANGSGKTSFLREVFKKMKLLTLPDALDIDGLKRQLITFKAQPTLVNNLKKRLDPYLTNPHITIENHEDFSRDAINGFGSVIFFEAERKSNIAPARSASSVKFIDTKLILKEDPVGDLLEQYLANLATRRAFAKSDVKPNAELADGIEKWFDQFDERLQFLFEDKSVHLEFDADDFKFYIVREGRTRFTFQHLSSGYSAILSILASLLMRAEILLDVPSALRSVVFIDELDVHLHVSLQRKIFPFLVNLFPNVQFIVTTHSPFVLTSVSDATIYDLSRREHVENLSAYSYEAVVEGLFGVNPSSILLQTKIKDLSELINATDIDTEAIQQRINDLRPSLNYLDDEAKFFVNSAIALLNRKGGRSV